VVKGRRSVTRRIGISLARLDGDMANEGTLRGARVLLVEDARDIREVFTLLLQAEGAVVTATGTGREAVELAARGEFDVLLTDLGLPDIPGDMVIRHVVATARRRPWVVVVTGYDEPFIKRARAAGADAVLSKPIAWAELLDRLVPTQSPLAA
jgi:two-component system, chemotaxis family, CheB/CheR fusion protein